MGKEPLGGSDITPFAQEQINGSTLFIDRATQVNSLALYLNVVSSTRQESSTAAGLVSALFKVRHDRLPRRRANELVLFSSRLRLSPQLLV